MHSLRLAGKRYFPGEEFELTDEQAKRLNTDTFVIVEPEQAVAFAAEVSLVQPIQEPQAKIEAPATVVQKPKKGSKRPGLAGTNTP